MTWRARAVEWLKRYLPLELAATATALAGAWAMAVIAAPAVAIAYAGAWAENIGFYTFATTREWSRQSKAELVEGESHLQRARRTFVQIIREFGPAEVLDSVATRPTCMYVATSMTGDVGIGVIAGKLAADVLFYAIVIASYEWRKLRSKS